MAKCKIRLAIVQRFSEASVDEGIGSPIFLITAGVFGVVAVGGGDVVFPDPHLRLS